MKLIDGTLIASHILNSVKEAIIPLEKRPGLAFIRVGDNASSQTYIRMKKRKCEEVGIHSCDYEFSKDTTEQELLSHIYKLNNDPSIDGILLQMPLPPHLDPIKLTTAISSEKDVDGFHPENIGKLLLGAPDGFVPCTPLGIHILLSKMQVPLMGKHVVILGRSNIVGKPLAALLMQKAPHCNATVTVANSLTENLSELCRSADILIAAIGKPRFVTASMVKKGATVIDVGINRVGSEIVGDVHFEEVAPLTSAITPVPGGVGPMTIAMLLSNTLLSFQRRHSL